MTSNISNTHKILIVMALVLGGIALLLQDKETADPDQLFLSFSEFNQIIQSEVTVIEPLELAELLMQQKQPYQLINFGKQNGYQIPTSESLTLNNLDTRKWRLNDLIILYDDNSIQAQQAYYLLLIRGYFNVKVLSGGTKEWLSTVVFPNPTAIPIENLKQREATAKYFGGNILAQAGISPAAPNPIEIAKKEHKRNGC